MINWISVEDRLPKKNQKVLICYLDVDDFCAVSIYCGKPLIDPVWGECIPEWCNPQSIASMLMLTGFKEPDYWAEINYPENKDD